jgi:hypothetical protein
MKFAHAVGEGKVYTNDKASHGPQMCNEMHIAHEND